MRGPITSLVSSLNFYYSNFNLLKTRKACKKYEILRAVRNKKIAKPSQNNTSEIFPTGYISYRIYFLHVWNWFDINDPWTWPLPFMYRVDLVLLLSLRHMLYRMCVTEKFVHNVNPFLWISCKINILLENWVAQFLITQMAMIARSIFYNPYFKCVLHTININRWYYLIMNLRYFIMIIYLN